MREIYAVSCCRTAIGSFLGQYSATSAAELGAIAVKAALERGNVPADAVDELMFGCCISAAQGQNIARQVGVRAGLPYSVPAYSVNMVCGSGMKSVIEGARAISAGDAEIVVCGGTENMTQAPYAMPAGRTGARMFDTKMVDTMVKDGLWDAFNDYHMGTTAENICDIWGITRQDLDEFALASQQKCAAAMAAGRFDDEIVPVTVKKKKELVEVKTDEFPRPNTTAEGLAKLRAGTYELVLLDLMIGEDDGLQVLEQIRAISPQIQVIMITAFGTIRSSVDAVKRGAFTYLTKPVNLEELKIYMYQALRYQEMNNTIANLTNELNARYDDYGMQGGSACMDKVRAMITKLKDVDTSVVITGESGAGKELVAKALHYAGKRRTQKYVEVNCAAIPDGLLESEFFGYKKGAFTGAVHDMQGKFVQADGGTLFLDEVAEMPLSMQAKFLRVLQERVVTPIGGTESINVDVRVVAATNRDLFRMVEEGKFREDLYYRLHVMEINVPPLRERDGDVMVLTGYYLSRYAHEHNLPPFKLRPDALCALTDYSYPGNVRQLFNILEYAALMATDGVISLSSLPREVLGTDRPAILESQPAAQQQTLEQMLADRKLSDIERIAILATLKKNDGQKKRTADKLGITDRTLRNKLAEYQMDL